MAKTSLKIGNAQAFWGDSPGAAARLIQQQPDLDFLTLDYLAEVSMSILAIQREKDPRAGFARDFLEVVQSLVPFWKEGFSFKLVTNAGGLNPKGCAEACSEIMQKAKCPLKIGFVAGDDVLTLLKNDPQNLLFNNLESHEALQTILSSLVTANAYFGAKPIVNLLDLGADIIITGRTADPSLTVAPCVWHYKWAWNNYNRIAGATVAGHLIECGTQVTGGISTNWLDIPDKANIGFPFVELFEDGSFVITKPNETGGEVTEETVKEQLLYEIGDPDCYLSPDATVSFLNLSLEKEGSDRIFLQGAVGSPPPASYKVSATFRDGFKSEGILGIFGPKAVEKARLCGEIILQKVRSAGYEIERSWIECLGNLDVAPGVFSKQDLKECILRVCVEDSREEAIKCFTKEIAPMVTSGPQGVFGYTSGRPKIRPVFGYWPCLIEVEKVAPITEMIEVKS